MSRSGCSELLALLLAGCGEPLADSDFAGTPLYTVTGEVITSVSTSGLVDPTVGILWGGQGTPPKAEPSLRVEVAFPNWYSLEIFQPPPEETRHTPPFGGDEIVAIGLIVVYEDRIPNAKLDPPQEHIVGTASRVALQWKQGVGYTVGTRAEDCSVENRSPPMMPANPDQVNLVIGLDCAEVIDPDCDPASAEWGPFCAADGAGPRQDDPGPQDTDPP